MKKAILSALLGLATILGAHADTNQVVSVNAVGYVNIVISNGFSMVANPLSQTTVTVPVLFSNAPNNTVVYKFDGTTFNIQAKLSSGWTLVGGTNMTVVPGEGVFVYNPTANPFTNTFVGEVLTGTLVTHLPTGFSLTSSQVPVTGLVSTDLSLPVSTGDVVYLFVGGNYQIYAKLASGWTPSEPTVQVGQSFWVFKKAAADWSRTFSISGS